MPYVEPLGYLLTDKVIDLDGHVREPDTLEDFRDN